MLSDVIEYYLKSIYGLQQREEPPVRTSDLEERGVEPGARLDMVELTPIDTVTGCVDSKRVSFPTETAASIRVESLTEATA
ncbi:iron dependent repressor-like protein [Halogeometricum borinquense DSM 11551]|uniref:Iron dependent repressor-like protein n=1 Tax=Halogeometricum borinquense (strain ATCC 700274 / DSM 11551 / JCM 10706 / KCTC 4070 / PR3) TaxID=469382 RepID=E4NMW4_HALBP|nr:hypothetical protein [Halogeometricum borinquense]ADQ67376.1 iron dependent repressor-like protein [Halogeometricum borinquense DSM 11551]ELY28589.1 iron dependent repressor-like protein [Halogeometricum borinquense DSM 11551]